MTADKERIKTDIAFEAGRRQIIEQFVSGKTVAWLAHVWEISEANIELVLRNTIATGGIMWK